MQNRPLSRFIKSPFGLRKLGFSALAALSLGCLPTAQADFSITGFRVIDSSGYSNLLFRTMNNDGVAVGRVPDYPTDTAYTYSYATNSIEALSMPEGTGADAMDINSSGTIVGYAREEESMNMYAFSYSNGVFTNLAPTENPLDFSKAVAVNDSGIAVGEVTLGSGLNKAAIFNNGGGFTLISTPSEYTNTRSYANDINNSGIVVGLVETDVFSTSSEAFVDTGSGMTILSRVEGSLGATALFINDNLIVGHYSVLDEHIGIPGMKTTRGFTMEMDGPDAWVMKALDIIEDETRMTVTGLNSHGDIVGFSFTTDPMEVIPFLYRDGQTYNLNELAANMGLFTGSLTTEGFVRFEGLTSINDAGQIMGYGRYYVGDGSPMTNRYFIMNTAVPEPSTWALLGTSAAFLGFVVLKRRRQAIPAQAA